MEIRDLGPLLIERDGLPVAVGGGRLAAVLSPLANRVGELVTPASLIDAVWGEDVPTRAGQLLESLIWRLRKQLEPGRAARAEAAVLRRDPQGYRLDLPASAVDSAALRAALPQVRALSAAADHEAVLTLSASSVARWRGEPYAGVGDTGWLGPARQELAELRLELAECRVSALLEIGRPEQALGELGPLLADHPFRERLWSSRMLGLYRAGRQADALAAFASVRDVLAEELGVDPGPELRELQRRILDQDPSLDLRRPRPERPGVDVGRLPRRRTELIGRDADVAQVAALLDDSALVTLVGPGGAGKTRLSVEVGHAARNNFPDGAWFVDLSSIGDDGLLVAAVAGTLGLAEQPGMRTIDVVTGFLADRRALLVLDNCEHLVAAAADAVQQILDDCPDVRVLATTREPLDLPGERRFPVGPLAVGDDGAASGPAMALFVERAGAGALEGADSDDLVRRICVAVDGLPLGIELAAALVRSFELVEIVAALEHNPAALARRGAGPQRQASLRDAVDWGYRLARGDEQILHRRLAVVPGPFTLDVAAALCDVAPLRADQALDLVGGLVHRSLLTSSRPARPGGPTVFSQLTPIRAHAADAMDADERAAVEAVRNRWFADRIAAGPLDGRAGQAAFLDWLDDNAATVRATLDSLLVDRPDPAGAAIAVSLVGYWFEHGRLAEATHWITLLRGLPGRTELDVLDRALLDVAAGSVLAFLHRAEEAAPLLRSALPGLATPPTDRLDLVSRALIVGAAAAWTGDIFDVAGDYVLAGLDLGSRADLPQLLIVARAIQAANWSFTDDPGAGVAQAKQVLVEHQTVGNDVAALFALVALTVTALFGGDPVTALRCSDELLLTHRRMGTVAVTDTIETRAAIRAAAGELGEAVRCLGASFALSSRQGRDWPWHQVTPPVLADLHERLDPEEFQRHWSSGERLGLGSPDRFTPEWI